MQPVEAQRRSRLGGTTSVKLFFWLYFLFVIHVVAIPFQLDLTRSGLRHRWQHAERVPFLDGHGRRLSLGDAVGNILFFVPFGFFLHSWRQARRLEIPGFSRDQIDVYPSWLAALSFSGAIECCQLFLDGRTASVNDVMANLAGALIGIRLAGARPGLAANVWERLMRMAFARPLWALGMATMAVQTFFALAPFDFSLKMENFQRQWLRWQYSWLALPNVEHVSPSDHHFLRQFPHSEHLLAALLITIGCGTLLGAFWIWGCHRHGNGSPRLAQGSTLVALGFYPALAILQFTVQSVHPFVLFPIAGLGGVTAGALLMFTFLQLTARLSPWRES
jgi:glycopeptide antibiotics resistance protein